VSPLTHGISRSTWYLMTLIFVSMLALTVWNVWYTNHVAEQSSRRWCGTLAVFHRSYGQNPPQTQSGRDIRAQLDQLYSDFHCDTVAKP
jgi:hypothetical protein